jgi:type II secretory pathway pseudopilin PulG
MCPRGSDPIEEEGAREPACASLSAEWRLVARRQTKQAGGAGSSVLQILIVAGVVALVAAIAVPVYAGRAKQSALQQNAASLQLELKTYLALDLDPTYVADGEIIAGDVPPASREAIASTGSPGAHNACRVFTLALRGPRDRASSYYVNPYGGSREVICRSAPPETSDGKAPAVWITDDQRYAYDALKTSAADTSGLRGTLVVVFLSHNGRTSGIDVYYVDGSGEVSPTATALIV